MQATLYHCAIAFALLQVHYISSYHLFGYARAVAGVIPCNKFRGGHRYGLQSTQVPLNDDVPLTASDAADDDFDAEEFEEALQSAGPLWNSDSSSSSGVDNRFSVDEEELDSGKEKIFRKYPFEGLKLPLLQGHDQYYSGELGDDFWHQNANEVFAYVPVDSDIDRKDVQAEFQAKCVKLFVRGESRLEFECSERIIPDGSFWTFEQDSAGGKYILLNLEKRFPMMNWGRLLAAGGEESNSKESIDERRTDLLKKLFESNKGISKLSGLEPESMEEMMKNGALTRMIADEVYPDPQVSMIDEDGVEVPVKYTAGDDRDEDLSLQDVIDGGEA